MHISSSSSELSLDYKPNVYSMNQSKNPFAEQEDKMQNLQEFLARLEEERLKIEAFKRELPLCMQLLNNAMEAYRRQLETYQTSHESRPVLEEFIPLKNMNVEESEKASWMVSAQLWSCPAVTVSSDAEKKEIVIDAEKDAQEHSLMPLSSKLVTASKPRSGGAFHPFSREKRKDVPELALASAAKDMEEKESCSKSNEGEKQQGKGGVSSSVSGDGAVAAAHRKARRCWSPDLHRRFVNALQRLGGSQAATPKQIRELMKVDGLTNDEVKSHLQKYRLHTRRPMPTQLPVQPAPPHLVVLGGIWVPPDYATSAAMAAAGPALYGAHPSPAHYCPTPPPPLSTTATQLHYHLPTLLHAGGGGTSALAAYKGLQGSPESGFGSGGERSESMEEEEEVVELAKADDGKVAVKF